MKRRNSFNSTVMHLTTGRRKSSPFSYNAAHKLSVTSARDTDEQDVSRKLLLNFPSHLRLNL